MTITEMTFEEFANGKMIVSKNVGGFDPAITESPYGYTICILLSRVWHKNGYLTEKWDYFYLDKNGLIKSSPQGYGRQYTRKCRIVDIEQALEKYRNVKLDGIFKSNSKELNPCLQTINS